ncbi:MAG: HTTM domain-containing protein [Planctomycetota bacterium]
MSGAFAAVRGYFTGLVAAWDRFWFTPTDPATLCAIRVATGLLLLWTHLVWSLDLSAFFTAGGWIPSELADRVVDGRLAWSVFGLNLPAWALWLIHVLNLLAFAALTVGWFSRVAAIWSYVAAVNYAVFVTPGAFFGLDKINCLMAMYVMLGPCGARYSLDRLIRVRRGRAPADPDETPPSWTANVALRLIQLHLCVVYLFGGLGKLQGGSWWDGSATWYAVANVEYRSLDMTWLSGTLWLSELLAHATVFWEVFYGCLVWNRWTRPWVLLTAVGVHGFIGLAMGMPEFAAAMLVANAAFLSPGLTRGVLDPIARRLTGRWSRPPADG